MAFTILQTFFPRYVIVRAGNILTVLIIHANGSWQWNLHDVTQHMRSIVLAGDAAYAAGVPSSQDPADPCELWVLSTANGNKRQAIPLPSRPLYDGLSASGGRL